MNSSLKYLDVDISFQKRFSYKLDVLVVIRQPKELSWLAGFKDLVHFFKVEEWLWNVCLWSC